MASGSDLIQIYAHFLERYEESHSDVATDMCKLCGISGVEGVDWVCCCKCDQWVHFKCDTRPELGCFSMYRVDYGIEYTCPTCTSTSGGKLQAPLKPNLKIRTDLGRRTPVPSKAKAQVAQADKAELDAAPGKAEPSHPLDSRSVRTAGAALAAAQSASPMVRHTAKPPGQARRGPPG